MPEELLPPYLHETPFSPRPEFWILLLQGHDNLKRCKHWHRQQPPLILHVGRFGFMKPPQWMRIYTSASSTLCSYGSFSLSWGIYTPAPVFWQDIAMETYYQFWNIFNFTVHYDLLPGILGSSPFQNVAYPFFAKLIKSTPYYVSWGLMVLES